MTAPLRSILTIKGEAVSMLMFFLGLLTGGTVGVLAMCLFQINRT